MLSIFRLKFTLIQSLKNLPSKLKPQKNCFKITEHLFNRMLRHSFLRVGEDIFLQYFILPPFKFLLCFSLYCLLASTSEARDGNKGNNKEKKIDTQTEQKLKGGKNIMLQRNIFRQPIEIEKFIMALFNKGGK